MTVTSKTAIVIIKIWMVTVVMERHSVRRHKWLACTPAAAPTALPAYINGCEKGHQNVRVITGKASYFWEYCQTFITRMHCYCRLYKCHQTGHFRRRRVTFSRKQGTKVTDRLCLANVTAQTVTDSASHQITLRPFRSVFIEASLSS